LIQFNPKDKLSGNLKNLNNQIGDPPFMHLFDNHRLSKNPDACGGCYPYGLKVIKYHFSQQLMMPSPQGPGGGESTLAIASPTM
jgi:hypothetical protein